VAVNGAPRFGGSTPDWYRQILPPRRDKGSQAGRHHQASGLGLPSS